MKVRTEPCTSDNLLAALAALAIPHRLRVIAALASGGRNYLSRFVRDIGISRPVTQWSAGGEIDAEMAASVGMGVVLVPLAVPWDVFVRYVMALGDRWW